MANILYVPQLSMYNKQTGELTPSADGNINMLRNTILEWKHHRPDDMFFILLPSEVKDKLGAILPNGTLGIAPLFYDSYVVSARINRYNFPMNEFSSILKDIKIDLIMNDVIEITPNFKQMFKIQFNYEPKIISNIRHVDESIQSDYILSVVDGIMKSDLTTILSDSMLPKLQTQIRQAGIHPTVSDFLIDEIMVFEPSVSSTELEQYKMDYLIKVDDSKAIITFPGRLSKGEEKRTNYDKFIEAINILRKRRQDFEVYFTDPNSSINHHYVEAQNNWIRTIPKDRGIFLNLLHKTDIVVSLMNVEGFGGISIREALIMDCLPIIPYVDEYKYMAPNENYLGFLAENPITVKELTDALEWAIVKFKQKQKVYDYQQFGMQFSIEEQFKNLLPKLEELLNE